jgi:hypothetical protein
MKDFDDIKMHGAKIKIKKRLSYDCNYSLKLHKELPLDITSLRRFISYQNWQWL